MPYDPLTVKQTLVSSLVSELARMAESAVRSAEEATGEMYVGSDRTRNRGERGKFLESAYYLTARAKQAEEYAALARRLREMDLSPARKAREGALLHLREEGRDGTLRLFLAPGGMGSRLEAGPFPVEVVSPDSPLGRALSGKRPAARVCVNLPAGSRSFLILSVE
ncbi:MAG: GreA/GreB family elongation factor [Acidobacteria bacterium]|nr:GreA/GreB family elongation factor [Acidobacteriota bacterium]